MLTRIVSLIIGYCLGCVLTAEIIAKKYAGKSSSEIGTTGNPGMANIMAHLGFGPGIRVLLGDVGKTMLAMLISWLIFRHESGKAAILYAGLGATLGHDFPFWRKFNGGKGVATTCVSVFIFSPLWGLIANIAGMLVVFATQYLCIGAVVIPAVYSVIMFCLGETEASIIGLVLTIVMFIRHVPAISQVPKGQCEKVEVTGAIKRKFFKNNK